jgi:hypothetical protein
MLNSRAPWSKTHCHRSRPPFSSNPAHGQNIEAIEAEIQRLQAARPLLVGDTDSAQSGQARDGADERGHRTLSRFREDAASIGPPYRCSKYEPEQPVEVGQPKLPNAQPLCHRMAAA